MSDDTEQRQALVGAFFRPLLGKVRTDTFAVKHEGRGPERVREALQPEHLLKHLNGGPAVGVYPMLPGHSTTMVALLDFDSHKGESTWGQMVDAAKEVIAAGQEHGLRPMAFRSRGGRGIHLLYQWDQPQDAYSVQGLLDEVLAEAHYAPGTGGVARRQIERFPKQARLTPEGPGSFGNMFVLPLAGRSALLDPHTLEPIDRGVLADWYTLEPSRPVVQRHAPEALHPPTPEDVDLAELRAALMAIPNDDDRGPDRDGWLKVIFALHHATGGSAEGYELALEWSEQHSSHSIDHLDHTWRHARASRDKPVTAATVFAMAKEHGWGRPSIDEMFPDEPDEETDPYCLATVLSGIRPPFMLIESMLRRGDLVGFLANPGNGKTAVTTDILMRLALGMPIGGLRVARQRVLMIAAENPEEVKLRILMWCHMNGVDFEATRGWVHFVDRPVAVGDERALGKMMQRFGPPEKWGGQPLGAVSVDTFSANFTGEDENSNTEVQAWINTVRTGAVVKYGPAVIILHHPPKNAVEWEDLHNWRGASAAKGTLDCTWASKVEDGIVTVNNDAPTAKNRMRKFEDLHWRLQRIEVPGMVDNLGCQVETVVAIPMDEGRPEKDVTPRWNNNEVVVLDAIEKDKWTTVAKITKDTGRGHNSIDRAMKRVKKRQYVGERNGTLYLKNSGRSVLEQARSDGWPLSVEVFDEEEELPKK